MRGRAKPSRGGCGVLSRAGRVLSRAGRVLSPVGRVLSPVGRVLSPVGRVLSRTGRGVLFCTGRGVRVLGLIGLGLLALGVVCVWAVPLPVALLARPSTVVRDREGAPLSVFLSPDDKWRLPVRIAEVDERYVRALFAFEDSRYPLHPGVDPLALARAAFANLRAGRVVSGGSTITMQLVRLVEPRPRTMSSKVVEALRAVQLQLRLGKQRVLELYLARAPYGRNLEGIETASWTLFQHSARALSPEEIAVLLALPQRPVERAPSPAHVEVLRHARAAVADRLVDAGVFSAVDRTAVTAAAVPTGFAALPRRAPHASVWLRAQHADNDVIETTIDARAQKIAEQVMASAQTTAQRDGIFGGAIVVVEHNTGLVRALVGGFDFKGDTPGAQIPAFATPRASGSTLKPFLYAQAIEEGRVLPDTLVEDVPRSFGAYAPRNFDGGFDGEVRLEDALSRSLNLPFVDLLQDIGIERFLGSLRQMGVRSLVDNAGHYGLSVAAGSLELTPLELAGLFVTLAHGGEALPLRVVGQGGEAAHDEELADAHASRIYSRGAAYLTRRALSIRDRPDFPTRGRSQDELHAVHWKTGTSFGHKDAWAAGSGPRYTVVVWQGNLDRRPSVHLVGAAAAAPLLFDVLEGLAATNDPVVDASPPKDLVPVELCALSGRLPGPACRHTRVALARAAKVPVQRCPFHDEVETEVTTGLRVLPGCRIGKDTRVDVATRWPAPVRRFLQERLRALPKAPSLHPDCGADDGAAPRIVSPVAGISLLLVPGLAADRQEVPFEAAAAGPLAWYVDGVHLGDAAADEKLWWTPALGAHVVVAMDERGRRARVALEVLSPEPAR